MNSTRRHWHVNECTPPRITYSSELAAIHAITWRVRELAANLPNTTTLTTLNMPLTYRV
jgi:hypothetical protein